MRKINNTENNIVLGFLRTYLIVLFIPLVICSLYCIRILSIIEEDDTSKAEEEIRYSAASVDSLLSEVEGIGKLLVENEYVKRYANRENGFVYPRTYKIIELQDSLLDISFTNDYIYDYFIYFDRGKVVINRNIAYTYEDFYSLYFHQEQYKSYKEWEKQKFENNVEYGVDCVQNYYFESEKRFTPMLAYELPLTTYTLGDKSYVKIYIKEEAITNRMPALQDNSLEFIMNGDGNIVYSESNGIEFDAEDIRKMAEAFVEDAGNKLVDYQGKRYLIVKYYSPQTDLTYYSLQPSFTVRARGFDIALYMLLLILFAAIIGVGLSWQMTYKASKPVRELISDALLEVESDASHRNFFTHLSNSYKRMKDSNEELREAVERQKPFIKNVFLDQLLYGKFDLTEDMKKNAEYVDFEYQGKAFWVVIFRASVSEKLQQTNEVNVQCLYMLSVAETISKVMPKIWLVNSGEEKLVAIMSLPEEQKENYKQYTEELVAKINEDLLDAVAEQLNIYGGTVVADMTEISKSYETAPIMQIYRQHELKKGVIWYEQQKSKWESYPSTEKNKALLHYVLLGKVDEVYENFKEIIEQFFIDGKYSPYMQNLLLDDLQINIIRIIDILDMDEKKYRYFQTMLETNHNANIMERIRITQSLYIQISQYVYEQKNETSVDISTITAYLHLNFGDCNLSLTSTAEAFQVSEGYLSSIFKQGTGINFSGYIERLRMDRAKELLKAGSMTIKEIADAVGYTSENSFCRAFKRVVGMNTSEWKARENPEKHWIK